MPFNVADLLEELMRHSKTDYRPWGFMHELGSRQHNLTVKFLVVDEGQRTSLQYHETKDVLLFILSGDGEVEVHGTRYSGSGTRIRIIPGGEHRVTGPLTYLEISSYDDGTDTIRLEDDYGRTDA